MIISEKVPEKRLKELERAEAKLAALEAGGVDSWEWYGESLKDYWAENEREEKIDSLVNDLAEVFGECAYEPSERGAGIAFNEGAYREAIKTIYEANIYFKEGPND